MTERQPIEGISCWETCEGCFYWSEMIAHAWGGPLEAMCLKEDCEHHLKYTKNGCGDYTVICDDLGAIDSPARLVFDGGRAK